MAHHSIDLDLDSALATPGSCPACHSSDLRPLCDTQGVVVFLCAICARTWVAELGTLLPAAFVQPPATGPRVPPQRGGPPP